MSEQRFQRTILVVDNDEDMRTAMCRILRRDGFAAIPAGQDLMARWLLDEHGHAVDLIVTDLLPPEPDGYHLGIPFGLRQPYLPVLYTATESKDEHVRRGLLHPKAAYLRKPFPPRELGRAVRETLAGWRALPAA
jgi:two-component system, cell cycle sensor histidine kinase and response regulator CckA